MKRSEINQIIKDMEAFLKQCGFYLPPFSQWSLGEWEEKDASYNEIRRNRLGWDVTDFGLGRYRQQGFALFTIRNGNVAIPECKKTYAEKLIMMYEGQNAAMHYHASKMEDIINRGGNEVDIIVYNADESGKLLQTPVTVSVDGRELVVEAGSAIRLSPGESITITPFLYHDFRVPANGGSVLLGEVSMCNDDDNDNFFLDENVGRFPQREEDEAPYRLLVNEYE